MESNSVNGDFRTKAGSKSVSAKKLSLTEGKKLAYKMIDKWAKKVTILEPAVEEVARVALYIEVKDSPKLQKSLLMTPFTFFESLSDE